MVSKISTLTTVWINIFNLSKWYFFSVKAYDPPKNWMGPSQQTPKEVARAIRYSGLGVRSVGRVGDFLDMNICDIYEYWFHFETLWKHMGDILFPFIFQHQHLVSPPSWHPEDLPNFLSSRSDMDGHQGFSKYVQIKSRTKKTRHHIKTFRYLSSMLQVHPFLSLLMHVFCAFFLATLTCWIHTYILSKLQANKSNYFRFFLEKTKHREWPFPIGNPKRLNWK